VQTLKDVITEQGGLGPVTGIDWHVSGTRSFRYPPTLSVGPFAQASRCHLLCVSRLVGPSQHDAQDKDQYRERNEADLVERLTGCEGPGGCGECRSLDEFIEGESAETSSEP